MILFGKNVSAQFNMAETSREVLLGIQVIPGECDCCGSSVIVSRIGFGICNIEVFVQDNH